MCLRGCTLHSRTFLSTLGSFSFSVTCVYRHKILKRQPVLFPLHTALACGGVFACRVAALQLPVACVCSCTALASLDINVAFGASAMASVPQPPRRLRKGICAVGVWLPAQRDRPVHGAVPSLGTARHAPSWPAGPKPSRPRWPMFLAMEGGWVRPRPAHKSAASARQPEHQPQGPQPGPVWLRLVGLFEGRAYKHGMHAIVYEMICIQCNTLT